jgi:hypothetical protein
MTFDSKNLFDVDTSKIGRNQGVIIAYINFLVAQICARWFSARSGHEEDDDQMTQYFSMKTSIQ